MRHVSRQFICRCFRDSIRHVADVFLRCPERNVDDETAALSDHHLRGVSAGDISGAHASGEHRVPAPERLLPEGPRPRKLAVLDHLLVAAPDVINENVQATLLFTHSLKHRLDLSVMSMVARDWNDLRACGKSFFGDAPPRRIDDGPAFCQFKSDTFAYSASRAGHKSDLSS